MFNSSTNFRTSGESKSDTGHATPNTITYVVNVENDSTIVLLCLILRKQAPQRPATGTMSNTGNIALHIGGIVENQQMADRTAIADTIIWKYSRAIVLRFGTCSVRVNHIRTVADKQRKDRKEAKGFGPIDPKRTVNAANMPRADITPLFSFKKEANDAFSDLT